MVFVGMNYGFGAGIVLEGTLFTGATGVSGEIGHTTVDENGEFCQCGNRGCLNTVASINRALELLAPIPSGDRTPRRSSWTPPPTVFPRRSGWSRTWAVHRASPSPTS